MLGRDKTDVYLLKVERCGGVGEMLGCELESRFVRSEGVVDGFNGGQHAGSRVCIREVLGWMAERGELIRAWICM